MPTIGIVAGVVVLVLLTVAVYDVVQRKHAILRVFPIIGHFRCFPEEAVLAFGLGCDGVNVGREVMLAAGCIQTQRCHTGHCPTGVATQSPWRTRALVPEMKAPRVADYVRTLRAELGALARACGVCHPALVTLDHLEVLDDCFGSRPARAVFGYEDDWGRPSPEDRAALERL